VAHVVEVLVEERAAQAVAGIRQQRVDRPAGGRRPEPIDSLNGRQIRFDSFNRGPHIAK
jgi:hypothetical protein